MKNSQRSVNLILEIYILSLHWILTQQVNVALKGMATQSSTFAPASRAIDGNTNSIFHAGSCTHTNPETSPWWRVDLLEVYEISSVSITNRGDCCSERINGAEIHIGNSLVNNGNNNPRCVVVSTIPAGATANYVCNMRGRYVNVILANIYEALTLCEVQVYVPDTIRALLQLKFNSSEDLTDLTMKDKVLQKMKSASVQSSVIQLYWKKEPELETET